MRDKKEKKKVKAGLENTKKERQNRQKPFNKKWKDQNPEKEIKIPKPINQNKLNYKNQK